MKKTMNQEWEEGYQAFLEGIEQAHNPYSGASDFDPKFCDWQTG